MEIQFAILGLLSWQSLTGYDLKKKMSGSDVFYWSGNNNQIYNNLISLHQNGMVTQEIRYQESLPAKKIYTITAAGREKLDTWLRSEPELPEIHNHFLIRLAWTENLSDPELDHLLARYEEEIRIQAQMRRLRAGRSPSGPDRSDREKYLWRQIEANVLSVYQNELDWIQRLRANLQNRTYDEP